ncbi:MAG: glycoside hydrolase family 95 protein [Firmicutes bacterium]|nr:glycoside hydrolase family 95 protein [Bacillota bacterium]
MNDLDLSASRHVLWYRQSASNWNEALPLGNGRIGAMVFGGIRHEKLALNEDTLWSGLPGFYDQPDAPAAWEEARELTAQGKYVEAQKLLEKKFTSRPTEMYLPLGNLLVDFPGSEGLSYRRELDLRTALSKVSYLQRGIVYHRECFISYPDQVLVMRVRASRPGEVSCRINLQSELKATIATTALAESCLDTAVLCMDGVCPTTVIERGQGQDEARQIYEDEPSKQGIHFRAMAGICRKGGEIRLGRSQMGDPELTDSAAAAPAIEIAGADEVIIYLAVRTSFAGWDKHPVLEGKEYKKACEKDLMEAMALGYNKLLERHILDHKALYDRCELTLPASEDSDLPTDERLRRHEKRVSLASNDHSSEGKDLSCQEDQALYALLFHYGRYLTIAASRPGTQAMNLQGIWNEHLKAPWHSNYTININTEMNYWPTLPVNLPECAEPLNKLIRELRESGKRTAKAFYDAPGFCAHHNTDLWRLSNPVGNGQDGSWLWALWPMSGGWLCRHLFEYYQYTHDPGFLKETLLPALEDAAAFYLSQLCENSEGRLVFTPATSPENRFAYPAADGTDETAALCEWTAMSQSIVRDVFRMFLDAAEAAAAGAGMGETGSDRTLVDEALLAKVREAMRRLQGLEIGPDGRILEWNRDFPEVEVHHRHVSHLYGLYPGEEIRPMQSNEEILPLQSDGIHLSPLAEAVRQSLLVRGDEGTGWSLAWKVCLWATLRDGDHAARLVDMQLRMSDPTVIWRGRGGSYPNLLCAHPPFQIDGNFGVCAGIAMMLLQEEEGIPVFLPALPKAWSEGSVTGLRTRDGRTADFSWKDGQLTWSMVR